MTEESNVACRPTPGGLWAERGKALESKEEDLSAVALKEEAWLAFTQFSLPLCSPDRLSYLTLEKMK